MCPDLRATTIAGEGASDELYIGDAIRFFLSAKRAGGRSERTVDEYRKKLDPSSVGRPRTMSIFP